VTTLSQDEVSGVFIDLHPLNPNKGISKTKHITHFNRPSLIQFMQTTPCQVNQMSLVVIITKHRDGNVCGDQGQT
jgi:hypothetical protein